jgi:NADPH:quinone reductase-like Zn-dependent oxidoreductase
MKALVFDRAGEPGEVLHLVDLAVPSVVPGHALIRVSARPIHPADLSFVRGAYRLRPVFPQTAGLEGAGTVVEAGSGVNLAPGTRVAFRWPGTWAEFAVVPAHRLISVPDAIDDERASQLSLNPVTAWALLEGAQVVAGDTIAVTAATSTVAQLVQTLAHERGITTIGIARGEAARIAASYPDGAFSAGDPHLAATVLAARGERRVQALIDCVGGPIVAALLPILASGAQIIAYGVMDGRPAEVTNAALIYANLTWSGFGIDRWLENRTPATLATMHAQLGSLIAGGVLSLPVASRRALSAFAEALSEVAGQRSEGKVLLTSP